MSANIPVVSLPPQPDRVAEMSEASYKHPDNVAAYSPAAVSICEKLMQSEYNKIKLAEALCKELSDTDIIPCDATYFSIRENNKFMRSFRYYLSSKLPNKLDVSRYGLGLVSDFDLYVNMATDVELKAFMEKHRIDVKHIDKLKKNRRNLRAWFSRFVESVLIYMNLPETPDLEDKKPDKKKAKVVKDPVTPENVQEKAMSDMAKNSKNPKKRTSPFDEEADDDIEEEDDDEEHINNPHIRESNTVDMVRKSSSSTDTNSTGKELIIKKGNLVDVSHNQNDPITDLICHGFEKLQFVKEVTTYVIRVSPTKANVTKLVNAEFDDSILPMWMFGGIQNVESPVSLTSNVSKMVV